MMFFKKKQKTIVKTDVQTITLQYTFTDNTTFKQKIYGYAYKYGSGGWITQSASQIAKEILTTGVNSGLRALVPGETLVVDDTLNPSVSVTGKVKRIEIIDIQSYFIEVEE
jgi:hypothetical protein